MLSLVGWGSPQPSQEAHGGAIQPSPRGIVAGPFSRILPPRPISGLAQVSCSLHKHKHVVETYRTRAGDEQPGLGQADVVAAYWATTGWQHVERQ